MKKESTKFQRMSLLVSLLKEREWTRKQLLSRMKSECGEPIDERTLSRYLSEVALEYKDYVRKDKERGKESTFAIVAPDRWIDDETISALKKMSKEVRSSGNAQYVDLLSHVVHFLEERSVPQKLQRSDTHWLISHGPFAIKPESVESNPALAKILLAIDQKKAMRIGKYTSSGDSEKAVEFYPLKMVLRIGQLYVMGYRKDDPQHLRTLRLDRMAGIIQIMSEQVPQDYFSSHTKKKIEEFYRYKFAQWTSDESTSKIETVVLKSLEPWFYRYMKDSNFDPPAQFDQTKKTITLRLYITIDFERWLLGRIAMGACTVVSPLSLKDSMEQYIR